MIRFGGVNLENGFRPHEHGYRQPRQSRACRRPSPLCGLPHPPLGALRPWVVRPQRRSRRPASRLVSEENLEWVAHRPRRSGHRPSPQRRIRARMGAVSVADRGLIFAPKGRFHRLGTRLRRHQDSHLRLPPPGRRHHPYRKNPRSDSAETVRKLASAATRSSGVGLSRISASARPRRTSTLRIRATAPSTGHKAPTA